MDKARHEELLAAMREVIAQRPTDEGDGYTDEERERLIADHGSIQAYEDWINGFEDSPN